MRSPYPIYLALIVGFLSTGVAAGMESTSDFTQYPANPLYPLIFMAIILAVAIFVLSIAYLFSDKKIVIKSLKYTYRFLCNNPSIFLIGLILSVILLATSVGIDLLKPAAPSLEDFEGPTMEYHLAATGYFISTLPFMIIWFIISVLIGIYFTAVFYCFIKNPVIGDAFSRAKRFYVRLLLLSLITGILIVLLIILIGVLFFVAGLITVILAVISPWLSIILFAIQYIAATIILFVIMLKLIFAVPLVVYGNKGPMDAIKGSWNLTEGVLLSIFVVTGIVSIFSFLLPMMVLIILPSTLTSQYLSNLMIGLLQPISLTATVMLYFNVGKKKKLQGRSPKKVDETRELKSQIIS